MGKRDCNGRGIGVVLGVLGLAPVQAADPGGKAKTPERPLPVWKDEVSQDRMSNTERGNWYFKKQLVRDARKTYSDIREATAAVEALVQPLVDQRQEVDKRIDTFYIELGIDLGGVEAARSRAQSEMDELQKGGVRLTAVQKAHMDEVVQKKQNLEQLHSDIQTLNQINRSLDVAIKVMMEQVALAGTFEQRAWTAYENIERTLSDEKAQTLLIEMNTYEDNIHAIHQYVGDQFSRFFAQTTSFIDTLVGTIRQAVAVLKEHGVALKEAELMAESDAHAAQEEAAKKRLADEEAAKAAAAKRGWWETFTTSLFGLWASLKESVNSFWIWLKGLFSR